MLKTNKPDDLVGGISSYFTPGSVRLVESSWMALDAYQKNKNTETICFKHLMEHIYEMTQSKAVVCFLIDNQEKPKLLFQMISESIQNPNAVTDVLANDPRLDYRRQISAVELTKNTLKNLGLAQFDLGIVFRGKLFPFVTSPGSYIVIYCLDLRIDHPLSFPKYWFDLLLTAWSDSFGAKIKQFKSDLTEFNYSGLKTTEEAFNIFEKAKIIHPWLRCSDICEICEIAYEKIEKTMDGDTRLKYQKLLREKIQDFGSMWHRCLDFDGPCARLEKGDKEFQSEDKYGLLNWYLWRLSDKDDRALHFQEALKSSQKSIEGLLSETKDESVINRAIEQYFLLQVIKGRKAMENSIEHYGLENAVINRNKFGRFMAERLTDASYRPESVEASIWLLSEYSYAVLNVDKRFHLASHLRHAARGEPSLHMMKDFYRDHFFHTIEVCQLGQLLADIRPSGRWFHKKCLLHGLSDPMKKWYLASLLHDIGYAVDICDSLKDWLDFFTSDAFSALRKRIEPILAGKHPESASHTVEAVAENFRRFASETGFDETLDKPFKDHGLMGAFHLLTLIQNIQKSSNIGNEDEVVNAIAKHNCQRIKIDYSGEPLAALLVLCDTLQSWYRPQFQHFSLGPLWMMSALNHNTRKIEPPQTTTARLESNIEFVKEGDNLVPQFHNTLILRLVFDEAVNRDSFVFNIWLDALCNFQRVDFTHLPFNIIVQIKTPMYLLQKENKRIRQMDRLRDASVETHMAYLDAFFQSTYYNEYDGIPEIPADGNVSAFHPHHAVSYYVQNEEGIPRYELLSFSLKEMTGDREFIKNDLSRFRKDLKRWKHYPDDRIMIGDYSPWRHEI